MSKVFVEERYKIVFKKRIVIMALVLISISIIFANILAYILAPTHGFFGILIGSIIGATIGACGNYILLTSQDIGKIIYLELEEKISPKLKIDMDVKDY